MMTLAAESIAETEGASGSRLSSGGPAIRTKSSARSTTWLVIASALWVIANSIVPDTAWATDSGGQSAVADTGRPNHGGVSVYVEGARAAAPDSTPSTKKPNEQGQDRGSGWL